MGIKYNLVCYLIYITIAAYGLGFLVSVVRQKKLGLVLYYLGFLPAVIAFGYRWHEVKYIPLQNMFEVFLCLGMLLPPISLFSRLVLRVGGEYVDMLIGIIILIPPGFVKGHFFSFEFHPLPPLLQSWIFSPHVGVYMLSYVLMAKAAVPAVAQLVKAEITTEKISTPFYLGSFLLAGIVPLFFLFQHLEGFALSPYYILTLYIASTLLILYGVTLFMILWYKAWHAIQDDQTRATPDKAVGFTLIPVYNIYWIFQLIGGFAKDYNSFVRRRKMTAKNLPIGYLRIYALLTLLYGILLILEVIFLIWDKTFLTYLHVIFIFGMIVLLFTLLVVHRICEAVRVLQPERISWPTNPELVDYEKATFRMIGFGFPFLTLGLISGSYWGKYAWGDFWGWDAKELWSLVSWLVYLGYYHFRYMFGKKHAWMNSAIALLGLLAIIITLLWVNLSKLFPGLHSYAS